MKDVIVVNLSLYQLFKVELYDQSFLNLDLGCTATNLLANFRKKDLVEEQKVLNFNKECRVLVIKAVENLGSRMPIGNTSVKNMSCLNPHSLEKFHEKLKLV